ncbi:hypothetical protein BKA66DRAFT_454464 [Pyrenochaeta sp. MPI-SDFR-AT-0127]|nr:hypothetical protein BKA66DRAFT_454464 [Pyrenochaeta sp. MPI-SDFR-AT-0127]
MILERELKDKIKEYHDALLLQSSICRLDRPSSRVLDIYRTFFGRPGTNTIVGGSARHMLDDAKDLAALRPPLDTDPLSRLLRDHWPFRGTPYPDPRDTTQHFLESHVKWIVIAITTVVAAILLVGAIVGLYFLKQPEAKLGMIASLTTLFAASVGGLTSAKRQEVFAASAAYAAVLVVFVSGNFDRDKG